MTRHGDRLYGVTPSVPAWAHHPEGRATPLAPAGALMAAYAWAQQGARSVGTQLVPLYDDRTTSGIVELTSAGSEQLRCWEGRVWVPEHATQLVALVSVILEEEGEAELEVYVRDVDVGPGDATLWDQVDRAPDVSGAFTIAPLFTGNGAQLIGGAGSLYCIRAARPVSPGTGGELLDIEVLIQAAAGTVYIEPHACTLVVEG